jgi:hypothetical protein
MKSLRDHEGYLIMDHSQTEGVPDEVVVRLGLPAGAGKGVFETATFTCSHCQTVVIINPDRKRQRAYCRGCNHLLCDPCGAERALTGVCRTFEQKIDLFLASKGD